jgi:hypothetical protein
VERTLNISGVHAVWLSGSAARGQLRHSSDIDWVVVTDIDTNLNDWPTSRHSFQVYGGEAFLRSLGDGHEFSVWQLVYGYPVHLTDAFLERLHDTRIARSSIAVQRKLTTLARRRRFIQLLLECEALTEVRREILLLLQQQLRVEILRAGYVPGCRAELEQQLAVISPGRLSRWQEEHSAWIERLGSRPADSTVIAAADYYASRAA